MVATRVAAEDAHRQHMEALHQLEENRVAAPVFGPKPRPLAREWSLEDFLKHHLVKFKDKTSPDVTDQWLKDLDRIFDAKICPKESTLAFAVYMLTSETKHCWINMKSIIEERGSQLLGRHSVGNSSLNIFLTASDTTRRWSSSS